MMTFPIRLFLTSGQLKVLSYVSGAAATCNLAQNAAPLTGQPLTIPSGAHTASLKPTDALVDI